MKKYLSVALCLLVLCAAFCGCNSNSAGENDTTQPATETPSEAPVGDDSSAEAIVRLYMDNKDVWEAKGKDIETNKYGYLFLDLDFDGTCELITYVNGGTDTSSDNKFYKLDTDSKTVFELDFPNKGEESQWDFTGGDYPKVYRNNETQELKYMVYDHIRGGDASFAMRIGELTLDADSNVVSKNLWGFKYTMAEASDSGMEENVYQIYDKDGNVVNTDEDTYNNTLSDYENNNTLLTTTFKVIEGYATDYTFTELSEDEQLDLLVEGYKSFSWE